MPRIVSPGIETLISSAAKEELSANLGIPKMKRWLTASGQSPKKAVKTLILATKT